VLRLRAKQSQSRAAVLRGTLGSSHVSDRIQQLEESALVGAVYVTPMSQRDGSLAMLVTPRGARLFQEAELIQVHIDFMNSFLNCPQFEQRRETWEATGACNVVRNVSTWGGAPPWGRSSGRNQVDGPGGWL
jgi:hypothetical protein